MVREKCVVLENKKVAPGHFVLTCASRAISKNARPGQFAQILCEESTDPLLPRPFSFLTAAQNHFSVLYHVVGKGTGSLAQKKKGDFLWVLGPLGNGFTLGRETFDEGRRTKDEGRGTAQTVSSIVHRSSSIVLVGGGVGIPPLYHLAQLLVKKMKPENIHVFLGARDKSLLLCEKEFKKLGAELHLATDDGSKGKKGFVTGILEEFIQGRQKTVVSSQEKQKAYPSTVYRLLSTKIYACGPTPMLKAISLVSQKYEVPCEVSVEVPMACGFGACIGCAIKVRSQKTEDRRQKLQKNLSSDVCHLSSEHRYAIACTEGPVFQAKDILWK